MHEQFSRNWDEKDLNREQSYELLKYRDMAETESTVLAAQEQSIRKTT
jgi:hypothetical protein